LRRFIKEDIIHGDKDRKAGDTMREIDNNLTNVNFKNVQPLPAVEDSTNSSKQGTAAAPSEQKEKISNRYLYLMA